MRILAKGSSMYPTMKDGSLYNIEPIDVQHIQTGDIIAYLVEDMVICHRIIHVISTRNGKMFFKTQGDNCVEPDPYAITEDMLIGKILL